MRSTVASGAHTPREKFRLPCFSSTTQWSPAAFTRRVSAASPGSRSTQSSGAVITFPEASRAVRWDGPGATTFPLGFLPAPGAEVCTPAKCEVETRCGEDDRFWLAMASLAVEQGRPVAPMAMDQFSALTRTFRQRTE